MRRRPRRSPRTLRLVPAVVAALVAAGSLAACEPPPTTYVALGDSFTAGPLIPQQSTEVPGCLRSTDRNYPQLAFPAIRSTDIVDASCSGARVRHLYEPQDVSPGPANPPQLDALDTMTEVVTLGIGGNDIGFSEIVQTCATQNPLGAGCRAHYVRDGRDEISERIARTAPEIARALRDIGARAPRAEVFVVGYPTIIPETGRGCYPVVPILPSDVPYLRAKAEELNAMIAAEARKAGARYVDTATPSIGHDVCSLDRWVEGLVPLSPAAPVHPNAAGMLATSQVVSDEVNRVLPG